MCIYGADGRRMRRSIGFGDAWVAVTETPAPEPLTKSEVPDPPGGEPVSRIHIELKKADDAQR